MAKPKILEIISEMRAQGMSDEEIVDNLRQLGLSDEQIQKIMEIADKDVESKMKREIALMIKEQLKNSKNLLMPVVDEILSLKLDQIKKEISKETDEKLGELAKIVNKKTSEVEALGSAIREENLTMKKQVQAIRADVDLLLAGPTKARLMLAAFFMVLGVIIVLYSIIAVTPNVLALNFATPMDGAILLVTGGMYTIFGIIAMMVGLHIYGKPA